jgi:hypothetical protein
MEGQTCVVCAAPAPFVCSLCEEVWFCGEPHQKAYWASHKTSCAGRRQAVVQGRPVEDLTRRNALRGEAVDLLGRGDVAEALNRALDSLRITYSLLGSEHFDLMTDYLLLIDVYQKFGLMRCEGMEGAVDTDSPLV